MDSNHPSSEYIDRLVADEMAAYFDGEYIDHSDTKCRLRDFAEAVCAFERERMIAEVQFHLNQSTMSLYSTHAECKAARDALQRLLDTFVV